MTRIPKLSPLVTLSSVHRTDDFFCGDQEIDAFLKMRATQEQHVGLSQVYVTTDSEHRVRGYFTISPLTVRIEPKLIETLELGDVPYPVVGGFLLGRLGVCMVLQGQGIGELLVMRAAQIAQREAAIVGGAFIAVDPKTEKLGRWYAKQEFIPLGKGSRRMILPLNRVPWSG
jgi:hypothetical protein